MNAVRSFATTGNRAQRWAHDYATSRHIPGRSLGGGGSLPGTHPTHRGDAPGWIDIDILERLIDGELLDVDVVVNHHVVFDHDLVHDDHDDAAR
jgi:hypothetical protein